MKTPLITIFVVAIMVIGLFLAFYDYKKHGIHEQPIGISKSQSEALKKARVKGEQLVEKQDYDSAIEEYKRAIQLSPRDPYIRNDLGAAYYYLGLKAMDPPIPDDEDIGYGTSIDARQLTKEQTIEKVKETLNTVKSGIITVVVKDQSVSKDIELFIKPMGHYIHIESEPREDGGQNYWATIITGKTKDYFLNAEKEYRAAIDLLFVRDAEGRKYSSYSVASRNLGTLYFRMGRKKEALNHWQRALQLEPSDQELKRLVDSYRKQ